MSVVVKNRMFRGVAGRQVGLTVLGALALTSAPVHADQFHYNNVILGERAVGLGGAYVAVADDASGAYYNPAGLAFALSNDISGSANAIYNKKIVYKNAFAGQDYTENAGGTFAPFFGILQKLDKHVPGLVAAFAYYTTDTELKDQNDFFNNKMLTSSTSVDRLHRTVQQRAATTHVALAAGYRLTSNVALGFGLNYMQVSELTQDYQDVEQSTFNSAGQKLQRLVLAQNVRQNLTAHGVEPSLGVQVALGSMFALGLNVRKGFLASQGLELDSERTVVTWSGGGQPITDTTAPVATRSVGENKIKKPLGSNPGEVRAGLAWFASTRLLWTFDMSYREAAEGPEKVGNRPIYDRQAVLNFSTGAEYYVTPSLPLRLGLFTNNDARPEVQKAAGEVNCSNPRAANYDSASKYCNQPDHIDYLGQSLFLAWVQPNSQIALGAVLQQGKGQAQKVGASKEVQDVTASSYTIGFSATQSF